MIMNANMCPVPDTEVPLVIQSPGGIKGLHYSINTVYQVKGMSKAESDLLFERINKELFVDKYVYDHWYKNDGDFLLFDNSITLHRRLGSTEGRMCYRGTFDYTHLQTEPYQPYFQHKYQRAYNKQIREVAKISELEHFKLPNRTWRDFVPF
jgi:alpha-ketoglutarate-dependent taurine dioxygenase